MYLTAFDHPEFGSDPIGLLQDHGVSTAPGNAAGIVDFFADVLFGGALTPARVRRPGDAYASWALPGCGVPLDTPSSAPGRGCGATGRG